MNEDMQIEARLWNYIDGNINETERQEVEYLLQHSEAWKKMYAELMSMQQLIQSDLELEEPSMRFTKNVMDEIDKLKIAPPAKNYINKNIIRVIAFFFLSLICFLFVYALSQYNFSGSGTINSGFDFSRLDISKYFRGTAVNVLLAVYVILGLVFLDKLFVKRKVGNQGV